MRYFIILLISVQPIFGWAQQPEYLTPMPVHIQTSEGSFSLNNKTTIFSDGATLRSVEFLRKYVIDNYGLKLQLTLELLPISIKEMPINSIVLLRDTASKNKSAYQLSIDGTQIVIRGSEEGIFYGVQTLLQLLPNSTRESSNKLTREPIELSLPQLLITDSARFAYRGMHLDVARHFFPVSYVKKYIDYLAYHKFNNFHWHLTDDQGWRIEIKKYPNLTIMGSCRNQTLLGRYGSNQYDGKKYCGYYTQEEVKEIVQYAADRYINVIPEIEMPGHSKAALTSYPFLGCTKGPYQVMQTWGVAEDVLCAGNDSTYLFLEGVLEEVMPLFPSPYIHIGGDECPKERWKKCTDCQNRIKTNKLKDEHELQSYFVQRIERFVNRNGKTIIGWDEILEGGLAPNAIVMSWRGEAGGIAAAKQQHYVIMTPESPLYINHAQTKNEDSVTQGGFNSLEAVYAYDPIPKELNAAQAAYIMGAQGNLWSEYISNERKLEYMLFPRMSALSEVLWSPLAKRSWTNFENKIPVLFKRYQSWGSHFSEAHFSLQSVITRAANNTIAWKLESRNKKAKIWYLTDSSTQHPFPYTQPVEITRTGWMGASLSDSNNKEKRNWVWQYFHLNKATGKNIQLVTPPNKSYSSGGAFSLVDGIQNEKGMLKSIQFLGFNGANLEAVIDLEKLTAINHIGLHCFEQTGSWIYRPVSVSFFSSQDGKQFTLLETLQEGVGEKNLLYRISKNISARYIKIIARNLGKIPPTFPGAGNNAWLFADEIVID